MADAKIVLFGANGYTGRLTAKALVERGRRPLLVGRRDLSDLASELGGLPTARADVQHPESLAELLEPGDTLITTVGPFRELGSVAARAAVENGAHYLDSNGEPEFIHEIFTRWGPQAEAAGVGMLPAMGYEYVPGNLAMAYALRDAESPVRSVRVGYFVEGGNTPLHLSGGTRTSLIGSLIAPNHALRNGLMVNEPAGRRLVRFQVPPATSRPKPAISLGGSEHFTAPRMSPGIMDVDVMLGWFGPVSRVMQLLSYPGALLSRFSWGPRVFMKVAATPLVRWTSGPRPDRRTQSVTLVVAEARDARGAIVSRAVVRGGSPYDFTGEMLAHGAQVAVEGGLKGSGALGPVDGLGFDELEKACADAGLVRVE